MIKFEKPAKLNGTQLIDELQAVGIAINEKTSPLIDGAGNFFLDIAQQDESAAKIIVANHIGREVNELS